MAGHTQEFICKRGCHIQQSLLKKKKKQLDKLIYDQINQNAGSLVYTECYLRVGYVERSPSVILTSKRDLSL